MEPQFDSLSDKVMGKIFHYFNVGDRQKFRLISKLCNKTITNLYGVTLRVRNINLELMLACEASSITGYFQSLTIPLPMNETGTDFLSRLTSLTFTGVIVCYNIFPVFEQCQQIQKLEFIRCVVNQNMREHEVHLEDPSKLLPSLRSLVIKLRYSPIPSKEINFFKRLLPFFTSESGKLDSIVLDCPCRFGGPLRTTFDTIFQKNSIFTDQMDLMRFDNFALTKRWLDEGKIADEFYTALLLKNIKTLKNLEMADAQLACTFKLKFFEENGVQDFANVQFTEFEQVMFCFDLRDKFATLVDHYMSLTNLLNPQTHLTKLSVTVSEKLSMNHVYAISSRNAATLKDLTVSHTDYEECLDALSLTQLHVLENLKYSYLPTPLSRAAYARIKNFNLLSASLRTFSTTAAILFENENDFNMAAFQRLLNLETFELLVMPFFQVGQEMIQEMDPPRIRQLISWLPSLKKLVLRNIHPRGQFQDGIGNIINIEPAPPIDSLPDTATDWINDERGISFQKYPIIIESLNPIKNCSLTGQPVGWETIYRPNDHPFEFPVHFDGVILIQPAFRQNTTTSLSL